MKQFRFLLPLLFFAANGHAQWQLGISGGIAEYQGDLTDRILVGPHIKPSFGIHAKYELTQRVLLRGGLNFTKVSAHDQNQRRDYLRARNFSFASNITEFSAVAEVHTFRMDERRFSPYVFGGLAVYRFNPYTFDANNRKVYLQPLSTEGQGLPNYPEKAPYALTQLALPFGGGLRYNVSDRVIMGLELGFRKLFTDYLDDISTNYADANDLLEYRGPTAVDVAYRADELPGGDPNYPAKGAQRGSHKSKDLYYVTGLNLSIRLGDGDGRFGRRSRYDCPKVPL